MDAINGINYDKNLKISDILLKKFNINNNDNIIDYYNKIELLFKNQF